MERVVDEAAKIQLDYLQKTLHDQQKRVEDLEQAIIDLAKRPRGRRPYKIPEGR